MKIVLVLFLFSKLTSAQDLILTKDSAKIYCQITRLDSTTIYLKKLESKKLVNDSIKITNILTYYSHSKLNSAAGTSISKDSVKALNPNDFKYAIHFTNPLGMFQKAGIKLEFKKKQIGYLLTVIQYYGVLPKYPGTQVQFDVRNYFKNKNPAFVYFKAFGGHQLHVDDSGESFFYLAEVKAGNYYGLGIGGGEKFNFNHFFIDLSGGFKCAYSDVERQNSFYITGPASYFDLHLCLGFAF